MACIGGTRRDRPAARGACRRRARFAALAVSSVLAARRRGHRCCTGTSTGRRRRRLGVDVDDDRSPGDARRGGLVDLGADDLPEVQRPARGRQPAPTHARPGTHGDERWVGVRDDDGAAGRRARCRSASGAGRPHLAGITVHPSQRGHGPGPGDDRAPDPPGRRRRTVSAPSACTPTTTSPAGSTTASATSPPTSWCSRQVLPDPAATTAPRACASAGMPAPAGAVGRRAAGTSRAGRRGQRTAAGRQACGSSGSRPPAPAWRRRRPPCAARAVIGAGAAVSGS